MNRPDHFSFCLQEIDKDYIKATHCQDPKDGREHLISEVSPDHMTCENNRVEDDPDGASPRVAMLPLVILLSIHAF